MKPIVPIAIAALLAASLSACMPRAFRIDVPQGNRLDRQQVDQLELGMSREQVQHLLGTPVQTTLYHDNQWYYVTSENKAGHPVAVNAIVLTFDGARLVDIRKEAPTL